MTDAGTTDTRVTLNAHEVTDRDHDFLDLLRQFTSRGENEGLALLDVGIDLLQDRDGKCSSLSGS